MRIQSVVFLLKIVRCIGKIGFFMSIFLPITLDMWVKATGGMIDDQMLAYQCAPVIFIFGIAAAGGEVLTRIIEGQTHSTDHPQ